MVTDSKVIAARMGRELKNFDAASRLKPVISSTTLLVVSRASQQEQIEEIAMQVEGVVRVHLAAKEGLK